MGKSKIAIAYEKYEEKMGVKPKNSIQFLGFCEKNNLKCTYHECAQYLEHIKKNQENEEDDDGGAGYANYGV